MRHRMEDAIELQRTMARELGVKTGVTPDAEHYKQAVRYVMMNAGKGVIRHETWEKIYFLIAEDVEQARAKSKMEFELA